MRNNKNLFYLTPGGTGEEFIEPLIPDKGVLIERIISYGASSPPDFWYEQDRDEWVVLLQGRAELLWKDGGLERLTAGDWVFIPARKKHRVEFTTENPPAVWLAVHGDLG